MRLKSLRTRVSVYLILTFSLAIVPSTLLIVHHEGQRRSEITQAPFDEEEGAEGGDRGEH